MGGRVQCCEGKERTTVLATWVRSVRCMYSGWRVMAVWLSNNDRGTEKTPQTDQSSMARVRFDGCQSRTGPRSGQSCRVTANGLCQWQHERQRRREARETRPSGTEGEAGVLAGVVRGQVEAGEKKESRCRCRWCWHSDQREKQRRQEQRT